LIIKYFVAKICAIETIYSSTEDEDAEWRTLTETFLWRNSVYFHPTPIRLHRQVTESTHLCGNIEITMEDCLKEDFKNVLVLLGEFNSASESITKTSLAVFKMFQKGQYFIDIKSANIK
jgi:hypothetical protein